MLTLPSSNGVATVLFSAIDLSFCQGKINFLWHIQSSNALIFKTGVVFVNLFLTTHIAEKLSYSLTLN